MDICTLKSYFPFEIFFASLYDVIHATHKNPPPLIIQLNKHFFYTFSLVEIFFLPNDDSWPFSGLIFFYCNFPFFIHFFSHGENDDENDENEWIESRFSLYSLLYAMMIACSNCKKKTFFFHWINGNNLLVFTRHTR